MNEPLHESLSERRFTMRLLVLSLLAMCAARLLGRLSLDDFPHVMDEITYDLQARMLAAGRIYGPERAPLAAFNQWFIEDRGLRYGIFPPGWPAILAIGHLLRVPAWINPVLHGLTTLLVGQLGRQLSDRRVALLAAGLYGFCPQALILAATRMSHSLAAFLALAALSPLLVRLFAHGAPAAPTGHRTRSAVLSGLAFGLLFAARPLCGVIIGATAALGLAVCATRGRLVRADGWVVLGALLPILALLIYNHALTGNAFTFPQEQYFSTHLSPIHIPRFFRYGPGCNALGFGPTHGCEALPGGAGHTVAHGIENTARNLRVWLLLAAGGGFLLLAALAGLVASRRRAACAFLLMPLLLALVGYATYWYPGTCYGARFYQAALPTFVLAAAIGLEDLRGLLARGPFLARVLSWSTGAIYALSLLLAHEEISDQYWGTDDRFVRYAQSYDGADAVVMVAFRTQGRLLKDEVSWTAVDVIAWTNGVRIVGAQAANSPFLDGRIVYARFHPALVPLIREQFPDRRILLYIAGDDPQHDEVLPMEHVKLPLEHWDMPEINFDGFVIPSPG